MPTTNFLPWDQAMTNTKTDAAYSSDPQRANGGAVGAAFPSSTFNKFGLQASGMAYALAQFLVSKGYNINDNNLPAIVSALQALFANVPGRQAMQAMTYSPSLVCDASLYNGFQIPLPGNVTALTVTNRSAGQQLTFQFIQQSGGGHTVTWPSYFFGAAQPDPTDGAVSVITWQTGSDLTGKIATPPMSADGLTGVTIGAANPQSAVFTTATVNGPLNTASLSVSGAATIASLIVNLTTALNSLSVSGTATVAGLVANIFAQVPNVAFTDNSNNAISTVWAKTGLASSLAANGYIKLPSWMGGLIIEWGRASSGTNSVSPVFSPGFTNLFVVLPISAPAIRDSVYVTAFNNANFTCGTAGSTISIHWVAIGN
jgi:hypothetical protein